MKPKPKFSDTKGFALIVTLSMMILLTVIAVGLLTLSTVALRTSGQGAAMATAKANSRLALMLAIGELQRHTGPDTRITARADVLDETNPLVLGAWKSWEGSNHDDDGRPVSPGNYQGEKQKRFLKWLVSGDFSAIPDASSGPGKVTLVGSGSVGNGAGRDKLQIHLPPSPIDVSGQRGAMAWWVGGENMKAYLPKPHEPSTDSAARWAVNMKSHAIADPTMFGMEKLLEDSSPALKGLTLGQTDLFSNPASLPTSKEFFHDLSTNSAGLLTNVATGGWRKDLSLLTEKWQAGARGLPMFRVKPGQDLLSDVPTSGNVAAFKSMLYPWSSYRGSPSDIPIYQHGAVSSWENLKDYALMYKRITSTTTGRATITPVSEAIDDNKFNFLHKVRVLPVIARVQWVFSHSASQVGENYQPRLLVTPVVTIWNPYNVEMTFSNTPLIFNIPRPLPAALRYSVGGVQHTRYKSLTAGSTNNTPPLSPSTALTYEIRSSFRLLPGENRVFSPSSTTAVAASETLVLAPNYRSRGGHFFPVTNDTGQPILAPGTASIQADAKFDTTYVDKPAGSTVEGIGVGIFLDMSYNKSGATRRHLAYRMSYTPEVAVSVYPPATNLASTTLAAAVTNPTPFLTTVFGTRMASRTHIAAKGFVQSSPLVNYTAMGGKDETERTISRHYGGTNHPVNSPFDYSFEKVAANDSLLPNESDISGRGYIVTGFTKADGLSRCVIAELPTRPLQSLAELQNWDLRYDNPIPPFAFNLIGNSNASPLLPANAVVNTRDAGLNVNLQHDDSYCANHLLFDDWFFSSIAPDPTNFGNTGKNLQRTYTDFVSGASPLGNHAYKPLAEDAGAAATAADANSLFTKHIAPSDSWKMIASRLEVEGMFNVNSTSFTAWRALLGHARNQKVPYIRESGSTWNVATSGELDHPYSRFTVAGDVEAKSAGSSGAFPEAAEFAGYRVFDEKLLDALATEIVRQVRNRGPFLSLAEFVNRQLSSGDLALAGTIQAALDEIAKTPNTNPYAEMESVISRPSLASPPSAMAAEYQFPEAAVGQSTFGLPGWTRQADVLRPLAPILSARDDTFTIRAYGDARDSTGKIIATATCEAVLRRTRDFVDPADPSGTFGTPSRLPNQTFGRRYQLVSFRWLNPSEI